MFTNSSTIATTGSRRGARSTTGRGRAALLRLCGRRGHWALSRAARLHREQPDAGMTTAEYAVGTLAACGFAALLYKVVTGDAVTGALTDLVGKALHAV